MKFVQNYFLFIFLVTLSFRYAMGQPCSKEPTELDSVYEGRILDKTNFRLVIRSGYYCLGDDFVGDKRICNGINILQEGNSLKAKLLNESNDSLGFLDCIRLGASELTCKITYNEIIDSSLVLRLDNCQRRNIEYAPSVPKIKISKDKFKSSEEFDTIPRLPFQATAFCGNLKGRYLVLQFLKDNYTSDFDYEPNRYLKFFNYVKSNAPDSLFRLIKIDNGGNYTLVDEKNQKLGELNYEQRSDSIIGKIRFYSNSFSMPFALFSCIPHRFEVRDQIELNIIYDLSCSEMDECKLVWDSIIGKNHHFLYKYTYLLRPGNPMGYCGGGEETEWVYIRNDIGGKVYHQSEVYLSCMNSIEIKDDKTNSKFKLRVVNFHDKKEYTISFNPKDPSKGIKRSRIVNLSKE